MDTVRVQRVIANEKGGLPTMQAMIYGEYKTFTCDWQADSYRFQLIPPESPPVGL